MSSSPPFLRPPPPEPDASTEQETVPYAGLVFGGTPGAASPFLDAADPRAVGNDLLGGDRLSHQLLGGDQLGNRLLGGESLRGELLGGELLGGELLGGELLGGELLGAAEHDDDEPGADHERGTADAPSPPAGAARPTDRLPDIPADVRAAALARVRARAAAITERVPATIATDDGVAEHVADAAPWLAAASERELRALIAAGWAGDVAVELVDALAGEEPEVADVVRHARRADTELVVELDALAASAWLLRHRPELAERLEDVLD